MSEARRRPFVLRAARFGWNFARDPDFRSTALLRWRSPENLFQPFTETFGDRYPKLFQLARETIGDGDDRKILSFGCSTGEEVFTLRKYFRYAHIKGIDINPRSIAVARARLKRDRIAGIEFEEANSPGREPSAYYDAVFAMAVFRHGDLGRTGRNGRCDHLIRFADFEDTVRDLARTVRPGGLLFIARSNFRFQDTDSAEHFDLIHKSPGYAPASTPIFDRNNRFIPNTGYEDAVFRKRA